MPLLLTETDVHRLLDTRELIDTMASALREFAAGNVVQPLRTVLQVGPDHAYYGVMPAYVTEPPALGTKLVTVFAGNAARGLPSHLATIVLLDTSTGALLALLDGRYITEMRTAAVSAVSARLLAPPTIGKLAILGSGVQARSHVEALSHVCAIARAEVWSPNADRRRRFAADTTGRFGFPIEAAQASGEAAADADLIVLATAASTPVLSARDVRRGAHIAAVGACRPDQREMDSDLIASARVFVDSRQGALAEAGDLVIPIREGRIGPDHIAGELGELIAGRLTGRRSPDEITIFKSLGMAVEDVAAAQLVYRRATQEGVGRSFEIN
jgi:ornithine cyclodeaminase